MSAARIIKAPPLSGGDRKYYAREIRKAEVTFRTTSRGRATTHAAARSAGRAHA
jgi:hypothetical protein